MMNPYKRIKEIDLKLEGLEIREREYKKLKKRPKELDKVESEIMFLCFERLPIEKTINWFEKENKKHSHNNG